MNLDFLQKNKDITDLSNFRTPAMAQYYFEVNTESDIQKIKNIYDFAKSEKLKILIIGAGTNLLFAFDIFGGVIIKNNLKGWFYDEGSQILVAYSAEAIWDIAENLEHEFKQKLWHRFIGLPGTIGGAIFGNAGCFGLETANNFLEADVLDLETGKRRTFGKEKMEFEYRQTLLKKTEKYFIVKAVFDLSQKVEKYSSDVDNIKFRNELQPKGRSCGSFFKNPSKEYFAGKLIEDVGLKGKHIGGAHFSEKHACFLMSDEAGCTYHDLIALIELAKTKVKEQFNIELKNEVQIITNN